MVVFIYILTIPSWYIIRVVVSNNLTVSDVWIIYSILWFVGLLAVYNDLWLTETLKYYLPRFIVQKKYNYLKTAILISLFFQFLSWSVIWFLLFYFSDSIALNYFHIAKASYILKYFSIYFVVLNLLQVLYAVFSALQDTFSEKSLEFTRMWVVVLLTLFFMLAWKWSLTTYSISWLVWLVLALFVWLIIFFKKYVNLLSWKIVFNKEMLKNYIKYALWVFLWANWAVVLWQIDQQMIVYFLWAEQAGYYTNYLSLMQINVVFISPLLAFLFPVTSELVSKKVKWKLKLMVNFFYKYLLLFL